MRKGTSGFTIVEVLTVIVIIGILAAITTLSIANVQREARDSKRGADALVIAEALEKRYDTNGEYPSCQSLITNPSILGVNIEALKAPNAPQGATSSFVCTELDGSQDSYAYIGEQTPACQSGVSCLEWQLQYAKESTGEIVTIQSRHSRANVVATPIDTPSAPAVTAAIVGSAARATASAVTCPGVTTPEYQFRVRSTTSSTDGTWGAYGAWGTGTTSTVNTTNEGRKYDFQAQARCVNEITTSSAATSTVASITRPISTPAAPSITLTTQGSGTTTGAQLSGTSDSGTWSYTSTCPTGTTLTYSSAYYRNDSTGWRTWTADSSTPSYTLATNYQGYVYGAKARARCSTAQATSSYSPESNTLTFSRTMETPSLSLNSTGYTSTQHSWTARLGATQYTMQYSLNADVSSPWGVAVGSPSTAIGSLIPGYRYYYKVRADNTVTGATSGWSNVVTSENLWIKAGNVLGSQWSFEGCGSYPTGCSQWSDGDLAYPASRMGYLDGRARHGSALFDNVSAPGGGGSTARTIAYNAYGKTLTGSVWVWSSSGSPTVTLAVRSLNSPPGGANELAIGQVVARQGQWSLVSVTANFSNAAYTQYAKFEIYIPANTHLWLDGAQLFEGTWGS